MQREGAQQAVVLAEVPERRLVQSHDLFGLVATPGTPRMVDQLHRWQVPALQTIARQALLPVQLHRLEEVALVQRPDFEPGGAGEDKGGAAEPVHRPGLRVVPPGHLVVAEDLAAAEGARKAGEVPQRIHDGRELPAGHLALAVRRHELGADGADPRALLDEAVQPVQGPVGHDGIGIEHHEYLAGGLGEALVAGHRETAVVRVGDGLHPVELLAKHGDGAVGGAVVHDDHLVLGHRPMCPDALQAVPELVPALVADDADREVHSARQGPVDPAPCSTPGSGHRPHERPPLLPLHWL